MYPQFMRPFVPGQGSDTLSNATDSYLLMINHMQRKGVATVSNKVVVFDNEKVSTSLNKEEKQLTIFLTETYPMIPAVPSGNARDAFLTKYREKALKLWPMLNDIQQVTPEAQRFIDYQLPVVFYPPTVEDKNISNELRQLLDYSQKKPYVVFDSYSRKFKKLSKALEKKPVGNYVYSSEKSMNWSSVYPEKHTLKLIEKHSAYVKNVKRTPWNIIKNRYQSFKFWAISSASVAAPVAVVASQSPTLIGVAAFFGLLGLTIQGAFYGVGFKKGRYLALTDEGKTLLKQVEAWENFKDSSIHGASQYDYVNLDKTKPDTGKDKYGNYYSEEDEYYRRIYHRKIEDMMAQQLYSQKQLEYQILKTEKLLNNRKKNSYNSYSKKF